MTAPKATEGLLPQINNYFEDERIKIIANFRGIRRCKFFRWLPFTTGCSPKVNLTVYQKPSKFKVDTISIDCDPPKHRENGLYEESYGWFTNDVKLGHRYEIILPKLDRAGNYEYRVNIGMKYKHKGEIYSINSTKKILSTGSVPYVENVSMYVLCLVVGSGLTLLIQWIIS